MSGIPCNSLLLAGNTPILAEIGACNSLLLGVRSV
jgi:hypothetical protein